MADPATVTLTMASEPTTGLAPAPSAPAARSLNSLYLPAPVRIFPLPTFYPNNPISLLHLAYAWLSQVFSPPAAEPSVVHIGVWDPETRSVHVNDPKAIRALWEQGFFGKGSLSRSEPNWLKRELSRRGASRAGNVSEERTESRREARRIAKWERAKAELEALEQQRLEEARLQPPEEGPSEDAAAVSLPNEPEPPVDPAELLALPNSISSLLVRAELSPQEPRPPIGPVELLALPNSLSSLGKPEHDRGVLAPLPKANGHANGKLVNDHGPNGINGCAPEASASKHSESNLADMGLNGYTLNGINGNGVASPPSVGSTNDSAESAPVGKEPQPLNRRKSVRFSPKVESTTFQYHDPPSPRHSSGSLPKATSGVPNGVESPPEPTLQTSQVSMPDSSLELPIEVQNKEHYQLAPIEAFFLVFALGALLVVDPVTLAPIPTEDLLALFRAQSYFPPREVDSVLAGFQPHDPFLVDYAVYHHFRSLGWVPRHGIKFGVDFLLYERGPAYNHSHFGAIIMPSFSHELWKEIEYEAPKRSWSWLMGINRVLAHVLKGLVLVYVDIPPPSVFDKAVQEGGIAAALKEYKIHEVMVRRFSVNRNR